VTTRPPTDVIVTGDPDTHDVPDLPDWVGQGAEADEGPGGQGGGVPPVGDGWGGDDSGPGAPTPRRRTRRRLLETLAILLVLGLVTLVVGALWAQRHLGGTPGGEADVNIPTATTTSSLATLLAHNKVVSDAWLFRYYLRYEDAGRFEAGQYAFHAHEGYAAALRDLRRGPKIVLTKLTIPEGFTLVQIADRVGRLQGLSAARFLAAATSGAVRSRFEPDGSNNLEGLAFPDTYLLSPGESEQTILQRMVDEFDQLGSQLGLDAVVGPLPNGLTAYQTITVASMIEREAKVPEDRGMIARVIINRLQRKMKLQIDATVLYALGVQKTGLTNEDLQVNSPYNTYRVAGLPPAPISNPGRDSLVAALNPTPGPWLYYVLADASGKHAFATTAKEFDVLVAQARAKGLL
jgi:UPF0755 protein